MMRQRILLRIGVGVMFTTILLCPVALAKETYSVRNGDTLSSIAAKHGMTLNALKSANHLNSNRVKAHQTLIIPTPKNDKSAKSRVSPMPRQGFYTVQKGDTLTSIARRTGTSVSELRDVNHIRGNELKIGQKLALTSRSDDGESVDDASLECAKATTSPGSDGSDGDEIALTQKGASAEIEQQGKDSAALLGRWNNPDEQRLLVKVSMGFLGAPYRLGGSSVTGIDCSGFVKKIYEFFNIDLPRTAFEQSRVGMRVSRDELTEGDLLFFNTRKNVGHVGIYIGNNKFVHACSKKKGVRVDTLDTPYYNRRFIRAVRLKGADGDV